MSSSIRLSNIYLQYFFYTSIFFVAIIVDNLYREVSTHLLKYGVLFSSRQIKILPGATAQIVNLSVNYDN